MTADLARKSPSLRSRWASIRAAGRGFARGVAFTLGLLVRAAPRVAAALGVVTVLQAALPVLNVRLTQLIVNNLAAGKESRSLLVPLLIYLGLLLLAAGLAPAFVTLGGLISERLTGHINMLLLTRVNAISDLSRFEDPALYDDLQALGNRAPHLARNLLRSATEVVQAGLTSTGLCL